MVFKEFKNYYRLGVVSEIRVAKYIDKWFIEVQIGSGTDVEIQTLENVRGGTKLFKSLDALSRSVESVTGQPIKLFIVG